RRLEPDQGGGALPVVVADVDPEADQLAAAPSRGERQQVDSARGSLPVPVLRTGREAFTLIQLPGGRPLARHPGRLCGQSATALPAPARRPVASGLGSPPPRRPGRDGLCLAALPLPVCSGGPACGRLCLPSVRGPRRRIPRLSRGPWLLGPSHPPA